MKKILGLTILILSGLAIIVAANTFSRRHSSAPQIYIAAGDVEQTRVVLWARTGITGTLNFKLGTESAKEERLITATVLAAAQPITVALSDLMPGTDYTYQVVAPNGATARGHFRTAAPADQFYGLRFGVSGDRRATLAPFVALRNVPDRQLDFFVALGDTIYADFASPAVPKPQAETLDEFRLKHSEVYTPQHGLNLLADLRAATAIFATIDDHEVTNDFAGGAEAKVDQRFATVTSLINGRINQTLLFNNGLQAFLEFHPLRQEFYGVVGGDGRMDNRPKLYRYRTFGRDAAIFLLDTRTFRDLPVRRADRNDPADVARFRTDTFRRGRTLLGTQQLADLKADLLDAQQQQITWKFVLVPEPTQQRGLMSAQDRFEGYAAERSDLLHFIQRQKISNVVFIAADIHGTLINNLSYNTEPNAAQIAINAFEVTTGPVAYYATLGPIVVGEEVNQGALSEAEKQHYEALPILPDGDSDPNDGDDFVKAIIDQELLASGFDSLGLDGSPIKATLLVGDYVALHSYGWSEFAIDSTTQKLTITTYGIAPYNENDLRNQLGDVLQRQPEIVSQFEVMP